MSDPQAKIRERLAAGITDPLQEAARFLRFYWSDEGDPAAVRDQLERSISVNPRPVVRGLLAIESLLSAPSEGRSLSHLVLWEANQSLDNPTEVAARAWLREVAEVVRELLGDQQPPRH